MALLPANKIASNWLNNPVIIRRAKDSILSLESEIRKISHEDTKIGIEIPYSFIDIANDRETVDTVSSIYLFMIIKHFEEKGYVIKFNKPDRIKGVIMTMISWNLSKGNEFIEHVKKVANSHIKFT